MLTGKERSKLKSMANGLAVMASIGKAGVSDTVKKTIDEYLEANELIKCSIQQGIELSAKDVGNDLAKELNAEYVQAIGRKFVLYRQARDPEKRKIVF